MSNAKNPCIESSLFLLDAVAGEDVRIPLEIDINKTKQVSPTLVGLVCSCQFQTCRLMPIPAEGGARCANHLWLSNQTFMESLILAQDERWRRA